MPQPKINTTAAAAAFIAAPKSIDLRGYPIPFYDLPVS